MARPSPEITLFHYPFSPWSQKITLYLALRRIPYVSCIQPVTLPRPDLKKRLGVNYRRIPVMSIGRDIYCDTLIMLEKLEELFPYKDGEVLRKGKNGNERALEKLLEKWTDVVVFKVRSPVFLSITLEYTAYFQANQSIPKPNSTQQTQSPPPSKPSATKPSSPTAPSSGAATGRSRTKTASDPPPWSRCAPTSTFSSGTSSRTAATGSSAGKK